jgi:hypothetical protein
MGRKAPLRITRQPVCMHGSQPVTHPKRHLHGPAIYRPGIDMGKIDAMSRMRDDETEESARIKALYLTSPAIDELFRLCDPEKTLTHERDHHTAYMQLHAILMRL